MLRELKMKHGLDVWVNQQLENTIEEAFKKVLETEELNYFIEVCLGVCEGNHRHEIKWFGKIRLKDFIKKVQRREYSFCVLGVTNAKTKSELEDYLENKLYSKDSEVWDYWIGDVVGDKMVCGDEMVIVLWDRIRDKVTKGALTK